MITWCTPVQGSVIIFQWGNTGLCIWLKGSTVHLRTQFCQERWQRPSCSQVWDRYKWEGIYLQSPTLISASVLSPNEHIRLMVQCNQLLNVCVTSRRQTNSGLLWGCTTGLQRRRSLCLESGFWGRSDTSAQHSLFPTMNAGFSHLSSSHTFCPLSFLLRGIIR